MITYKSIREGIASALMVGFGAYPIEDETSFRVGGPSFVVQLADNSHELANEGHLRRVMDFNVVYLPSEGDTVERIVDAGLKAAGLLQPVIRFAGRAITVNELSTTMVDSDFMINFRLDFYDELGGVVDPPLMSNLEFTIDLIPDKEW